MANYSVADKVRGHNVLLNMDRNNSGVMELKEETGEGADWDFRDMFGPEIKRPSSGAPKKPKKVKPITLRDYKNIGRKAVPFSSHEELFKLYVTKERSLCQMALILGKDLRQIRRRLVELGIPIRHNLGRKPNGYC